VLFNLIAKASKLVQSLMNYFNQRQIGSDPYGKRPKYVFFVFKFEVKELLKLIDQIRARYPEKEDISSLDILKYVQELNGGSFNGGPYGGGGWPYRTFNMWLLQHHRRNTLGWF
jgi:hypothetical protein